MSQLKVLKSVGRSCLLAVSMLCFVGGSAHADVVAYWDFEDGPGATTADQTANGNTATLIGGTAFDSSTPLPLAGSTQSMRFNGTDGYLTVADSASISVTGSLTLSAWIKLDNPNEGPGSEQTILAKDRNASYRWGLRNISAVGNYNPARVILNDGSTTQSNIVGAFANGSVWKHVAAVMDFSTGVARHYQDGVQIGADTALTVTGIADSAGSMLIGAFNPSSSFFDGVMDDVAIFDQALSLDQIVSLSDGSKTPLTVIPEPGAMGLFVLGLVSICVRRARLIRFYA